MQQRHDVLGHLNWHLDQAPHDDESWLASGDLYLLIRWCLLKADGRWNRTHIGDAEQLYHLVVKQYQEAGGFISTVRGQHYYHSEALSVTAAQLAWSS